MSVLVFLFVAVVLLLIAVCGIICRGPFNKTSISFMETLLDV